MSTSNRYAPEGRERSVRVVAEHQHEYPSEWAAVTSITSKGRGDPQPLRKWVRRAELDGGGRVAAVASVMVVESGFNIEKSGGSFGVEPTPARHGSRLEAR